MTSQKQLSEHTAEVLRTRILTGELPPGHRLAPERQLTIEFGISRTALREALQALEGMGLVEAQVGRGRFVRAGHSAARGVEQISNWLQMYRTDVADLSEIRQLLEPRALARTPAASVQSILERASDVLLAQRAAVERGDLQRAGELDAQFHTCLIRECANRSIQVLAEALISSATPASVAVYLVPGAAAHSLLQHEQIIAALAGGDRRLAQQLLAIHQRTASKFAVQQHLRTGPGS